MGRRAVPRDERHAQLKDVARELVKSNGVAALTMTALAEASGAAKPVVYSHFKNREAVAIALIDDHFQSAINYVLRRVADATNLEEHLTKLIESAIEYEIASDSLIRKITNGFSSSEVLNEVYKVHQANFRKMYKELLEEQSVPEDIAEIASHGLSGLLDQYLQEYANNSNTPKVRAVIKSMLLASINSLERVPTAIC